MSSPGEYLLDELENGDKSVDVLTKVLGLLQDLTPAGRERVIRAAIAYYDVEVN